MAARGSKAALDGATARLLAGLTGGSSDGRIPARSPVARPVVHYFWSVMLSSPLLWGPLGPDRALAGGGSLGWISRAGKRTSVRPPPATVALSVGWMNYLSDGPPPTPACRRWQPSPLLTVTGESGFQDGAIRLLKRLWSSLPAGVSWVLHASSEQTHTVAEGLRRRTGAAGTAPSQWRLIHTAASPQRKSARSGT